MSLISKKELEINKWELKFSISAEDFKVAVTKAYKTNVKNVNVQGFRKGKAPQAIIEKLYGQGFFYNEAIDIALPEAYTKALDEFKMEVVSRPEIKIESVEKEDGVVVVAEVYTKPNINISDYKGLKADKILLPVTDEDIDKVIDETRQKNGRTITVENRKTETNDTVIIDFEGFCDGVAFAGGKGDDFSLTLGSGQFIPGFEEQLIGFNTGEDVEVNVTFPKEYHSEDLAGKETMFKVLIKEVKATELPVLDDEFAKDVSEFDNLKDYRNSIKENMEKSRNEASEREFETKLVNMIAEKIEGDIPEIMFEITAEEEMTNFTQRLKSQGMDLNMYLQYTGSSVDMMKATFKEQANTLVKSRLGLGKIVELEKIIVSDDDANKEYEKLAESYKISIDDVKKHMDSDRIKEEMAMERAVEFVKNSAKMTLKEKIDEVEKKPVKKVVTAKKDSGEEKPKRKVTTKKVASKEDVTEEKPKKVKRVTKKDEN